MRPVATVLLGCLLTMVGTGARADLSGRAGQNVSADWAKGGWSHASLWLGASVAGPLQGGGYRSDPGLEFGVSGYDRRQRLTLTAFTADGRFHEKPATAPHDLRTYGWSLSLSQVQPLGAGWNLTAGAGYTSGLLVWDYAEPPTQDGERIETDSQAFHGLVMPFTLQNRWGPVWLELAATPTVRLSAGRTRAGLRLETDPVHTALPLSLRLGVAY